MVGLSSAHQGTQTQSQRDPSVPPAFCSQGCGEPCPLTPGTPSPEVVEGPVVVVLTTNPSTVFAPLDKDIFKIYFYFKPLTKWSLSQG